MKSKTICVRDDDDESWVDQLVRLKKEQFNLRFQAGVGAARKHRASCATVRRDIARIKTITKSAAPAAA
jgi:large subunit ribosomal protein L29